MSSTTKQTANSSKAVNSSLSLKGSKKKIMTASVPSSYHIQITDSVAEISVSISISSTTGGYVRTYAYIPVLVMSTRSMRTRLEL